MAGNWTAQRIETLRALWAEGKSGGEIAFKLGGITASAVIGKVHRLGLASRTSPIMPAGSGRRPGVNEARKRWKTREVASEPNLCPEQPAEPLVVYKPRAIPDESCRFPLGEVRQPGFRFCDEPVLTPGRIYCDAHHMLCCLPAPAPSQASKRFAAS